MSTVNPLDSAERRLSLVGGLLMLWAVAGGGLLVMMLGQVFIGAIVLAVGVVLGMLLISGRLRQGTRFTTANFIFMVLGVVAFDLILMLQTPLIPPDRRVVWYAYLALLVVLSGATLYFAAKIPRQTGEASPHS